MEPSISVDDIQDLIRTRAYRLWESEGRPEGMEHQHWLAAEKEVLEEVDRSGATGPTVSAVIAHEPRQSGNPDEHQEDLLDEAIEETFPASDPVSPKQIT
jgi:hypothetical protein